MIQFETIVDDITVVYLNKVKVGIIIDGIFKVKSLLYSFSAENLNKIANECTKHNRSN